MQCLFQGSPSRREFEERRRPRDSRLPAMNRGCQAQRLLHAVVASLAACNPTPVASPRDAGAWVAVFAVLDSSCVGRPGMCDSVVVDRTVRTIRDFLPSQSDSMKPAFDLQLPSDANYHSPRRLGLDSFGLQYTAAQTNVRVTVFLVGSPTTNEGYRTKRYTVAMTFPNRETIIAVVELSHDGHRWIPSSVRCVQT
jgi:hypothetical protein